MATQPNRSIVFYDGVCGMCNNIVRFVLERDPIGHFRFSPLQSEFASQRLRAHGRDPEDLDTMYLLVESTDGETVFERSAAAFEVLSRLGGGWWLVSLFRYLPRFLTDAVYDFVAGRRYRWFGKHDACPLPPAAMRARFVERQLE